ncbi:MAG: hypothetical protein MUO62_17415, partial [Anaerolineales bacterium]|nr:hypothetical protein [Anaerolineales bacterium]
MKIVFAAPTYLPSRRANTLQVMKMAQATRDLGHSIRLLVPDPGGGEVLDWGSLAHHYGLQGKIDIEWLPVKAGFRGYDYGLKAVRYARRWGADLLYTRLPQAAAFASSLKIPTIFEVHDLPAGFMGPILFRSYLRGGGACRLVLITKFLRDEISSKITPIPEPPFTLIEPDGVDLERYENIPGPEDARRRLQKDQLPHLPVPTFTVGYTGHLYPGRGIDLILDMATELPGYTFLLVGGNPKAVKEVQDEVDQRAIENVILTGFVPNADLSLYQAACDVLLMPYQQSVAASSGGDIAHFLSPMKLFEYL